MPLKRTPGPWKHQHGSIRASNGYIVAKIADPVHLQNEITEANGRLLAAAPELLEALERLLDFHNEGRVPTAEALTVAEGAILAARGEA